MFNIEEWKAIIRNGTSLKTTKLIMRNFLNAVAKESGVEVSKLEVMSVAQIVKEVVLPKILCSCDCPNFGMPRFMQFMADWGRFIFQNAHNEGELLFELGMQRLSRGALLHEGVNLVKILPKECQKYTFQYEEFRIMTTECYDFLANNLEVMFNHLGPQYREHCHKIVFGIMQHVEENGETDLLWDDEIAGHTVVELRELVKPYATIRCSENERWEYLCRVANNSAYRWVINAPYGSVPVEKIVEATATRWQQMSDFYRDFYAEINWKQFRKKLDLDKYRYYTGFSKKALKFIGLYDWMTYQAIKAEIRG